MSFGFAPSIDSEDRVAPSLQPTFEDRALESLLEASDAAQKGDETGLRIALARAACFVSEDDLEALRMEHNLNFSLRPQLVDVQRDRVPEERRRYSFADVH